MNFVLALRAMEQHPIPQQISSYQFRLVGDMTLKQFFQLAGGILAGLIFYSSPLLGIIKWPLAIISIILGVALAFLPLEERPLEKWIIAFFRAIYAPTIFNWRKGTGAEKYFQDESAAPAQDSAQQEAAVEKYLGGKKVIPTPLENLEKAEQGFLLTLTGLFAGVATQVAATVKSQAQVVATQTPTSAGVPQTAKPKTLEIPQTQPVRVAVQGAPRLVVEEKTGIAHIVAGPVAPVIAGNEFVSTHQAQFSVDAAPPNPPESPNVVVGQVVDDFRRILGGAIIEIRDSAGRPVRALRSNQVGHFITVTPLENGQYEIITEKDGYTFTPVSFEVKGELIPPILVRGKLITDQMVSSSQALGESGSMKQESGINKIPYGNTTTQ